VNGLCALLGLLHPLGAADRVGVLRGAYQDRGAGCTDLVLLVPARPEASDAWLARAVADARRFVAADGLVCVVAPGIRSRRARQLLTANGLRVSGSLALLKRGGQSPFLVPLEGPALATIVSQRLAAGRPLRQRAIRLAVAGGGKVVLSRVIPQVIVAHASNSERVAAWLTADGLEDAADCDALPMMAMSWRGRAGGVVVDRGSRNGARLIAKVSLAPDRMSAPLREAAVLRRLRPAAAAAGARVPQPLRVASAGGRPALIEHVLEGMSAADVLRARPARLAYVADATERWLGSWNVATRGSARSFATALTANVVRPLEAIGASRPDAARLFSPPSILTAALERADVPSVAAHNDLTMRNVLIDPVGVLGVVDWETARPHGLPFADLAYSFVDAAYATGRFRSRVDAYEACFAPRGPHTRLFSRLRQQLALTLSLDETAVALCVGAGWLRHAANELSAQSASEDGPFLQIATRAIRSLTDDVGL
jgi:hypothetical protein